MSLIEEKSKVFAKNIIELSRNLKTTIDLGNNASAEIRTTNPPTIVITENGKQTTYQTIDDIKNDIHYSFLRVFLEASETFAQFMDDITGNEDKYPIEYIAEAFYASTYMWLRYSYHAKQSQDIATNVIPSSKKVLN
jgi:hypothetical protein